MRRSWQDAVRARGCWPGCRSPSGRCSWPACRPRCWRAAPARRWSCCTAPGEFAAAVVAGDPGPGDDPPGGRPRSAGPRRLELVDDRLDADRVLAWLGELIERTCAVAAGAGGARARGRHRGPLRRRPTAIGSPGWCWWTRSAWPSSSPAPSFGLALHRFLEEPTEHTRDGLFRQCFVDLDRLRAQMGERWEPLAAYALDRARTPSQQAALEALMAEFGMPAIPPRTWPGSPCPPRMIWGRHDLQVAAARRRDGERPLRLAAAGDRATPVTTRPWNSPRRSWRRCIRCWRP